jgi:hypothetical protein
MKKAVLTLTTIDYKGNPIGDLDLTMEFLKPLPAPLTSLFSFNFAPLGVNPVQFNFVYGDAVIFFRLLANIMAPGPVNPQIGTHFNTADNNGNPNGGIKIKMTKTTYLDTPDHIVTYFSYSFLPDNAVELGFLLDTNDADVFYYDFDCLMTANS